MWDSNQGSLNPKSDALSSPSDGYTYLSLSHRGFFQFTVRVEEFRLVVRAPVSFWLNYNFGWFYNFSLFGQNVAKRHEEAIFFTRVDFAFSICCSFFISRNLIFVG